MQYQVGEKSVSIKYADYLGPGIKQPSPPEGLSFNLGHEMDWRKFVKLNAMDRPGLTEDELFGLFVKCEGCKLVMTHQVFVALKHHCFPMFMNNFTLPETE